eukprot:m.162075 g.162075  ORF g.162075 m.162075 type:complete len:107 (+) comp38832_c0_seq2:1980-2300(+)
MYVEFYVDFNQEGLLFFCKSGHSFKFKEALSFCEYHSLPEVQAYLARFAGNPLRKPVDSEKVSPAFQEGAMKAGTNLKEIGSEDSTEMQANKAFSIDQSEKVLKRV